MCFEDFECMRNLHIATVGKSIGPIIEGIRAYPIDELYLLYNEGSHKEALEIRKSAEDWKLKCNMVEVKLFDIEDIFVKILLIQRRNINSKIFINVTGGTKIMSNAAFIAGYLIGANIYYIREAQEDESLQDCVIELPVPKIQMEDIDENQKRILSHLLNNDGRISTGTTELSKTLLLTPQLVSYHLNRLENANLIKNEKKGRISIISLTGAGRFAAKYHEDTFPIKE